MVGLSPGLHLTGICLIKWLSLIAFEYLVDRQESLDSFSTQFFFSRLANHGFESYCLIDLYLMKGTYLALIHLNHTLKKVDQSLVRFPPPWLVKQAQVSTCFELQLHPKWIKISDYSINCL